MRRHKKALCMMAIGFALAAAVTAVYRSRPSRATEARQGAPALSCDACAPPPGRGRAEAGKPPAVPTGSGLPCVVAFLSASSEESRRMLPLLDEATARLRGTADVVRIDADEHRGEAVRWRLRRVPTVLFVDAAGKELGRREGLLPAEEIAAVFGAAATESRGPAP